MKKTLIVLALTLSLITGVFAGNNERNIVLVYSGYDSSMYPENKALCEDVLGLKLMKDMQRVKLSIDMSTIHSKYHRPLVASLNKKVFAFEELLELSNLGITRSIAYGGGGVDIMLEENNEYYLKYFSFVSEKASVNSDKTQGLVFVGVLQIKKESTDVTICSVYLVSSET